jgi:hypothetical protein
MMGFTVLSHHWMGVELDIDGRFKDVTGRMERTELSTSRTLSAVKAFIIGAGATTGTFPDDACGVKRFGKTLVTKWKHWRSDLEALAKVVTDAYLPATAPDDWDLDTVWTHVDYYAKLHEVLRRTDYGGSASVQLHQAVAAVFGPLGERARELFSRKASTSKATLRGILHGVRNGDVVASMNWDTLTERILVELGRNRSPRPTTGCRFVKPHGSLSWIHRPPTKRIHTSYRGVPLLTVQKAQHVSGNAQPILLGAIPLKSELMREIQNANGKYELVVGQWKGLCNGLKTAKAVVTVGYSFPPEDHYGMFLIREALKRRKGRPLEEISFYELASQAPIVAERITRLLPAPGTRVTWKGPVERGIAP